MKLRVLAGVMATLIFSTSSALAETIFIRTLTGERLEIEIALNDSVASLKAAVEEANGVPPERQRLIFAGTELEDEQSLADYSMHEESTVHLVIRLNAP